MKGVSLTLSQKQKIASMLTANTKQSNPFPFPNLPNGRPTNTSSVLYPTRQNVESPQKSSILLARPQASLAGKTREKRGRNHILEMALFNWVIDQQARRVNISGDMIIEKAKRMQINSNEHLAVADKSELKFSAGWLDNFKSQWNLRVFKSHGEIGDADLEAAARELPIIREKLKGYDPRYVYNADECGLFLKMAPDKTIYTERLPGRKKTKDRISLLFCCNADGSHKFEVMIIGKSRQPRAFKKKATELGLDYHANSKAWMTAALFFEWLERFNAYIARTFSRKVALLIDNCSAHGTLENLPSLSNVEVIFLPPNTTSKLQPLDAGIIASLKLRYRKKQMEHAVE